MHKVAIIDDYQDSCTLISEILSPNFTCQYTYKSEEAFDLIHSFRPDLILMDYNMPKLNGVEVCRSLKKNAETQNIPIIFISGVASTDEKISTLESGGDDFIQKPFDPRELILRIQKRIQSAKQALNSDTPVDIIKVGNMAMNIKSRLVHVLSKEIVLTPKQFEILKLLVENKNNVISRQVFMQTIWGHSEVTPRNVDSQINYLKKKIEGFDGIITAVPSFGYRLDIKN